MRAAILALTAAVAAALVWGVARGGVDHRVMIPATAQVVPDVPAARVVTASRRAACAGGSVRPAAAERPVAVRVVRPVIARTTPRGAPRARFGLRNANGVRTVFAVRATLVGADCAPRWFKVQLPIRPNGVTGWVRARDVRSFRVAAQVIVDLSDRRVVVERGGKVVLHTVAAIGNPATPTPTGRFYVNQRLWAGDPSGPWGPGGVGISAYSPVLVHWTQGGPIAIHGTNQPYLIGAAVSHGCIRVSNYALLRLMKLAPEGTPVVIRQ
jgi:lipoprotein-anchoring transpeptidase ErfK/SrfK